jgi:hypothetical protein
MCQFFAGNNIYIIALASIFVKKYNDGVFYFDTIFKTTFDERFKYFVTSHVEARCYKIRQHPKNIFKQLFHFSRCVKLFRVIILEKKLLRNTIDDSFDVTT